MTGIMKIYKIVNERTKHEVEVRISENYISVYRFVNNQFGYLTLYADEYEGNVADAINDILYTNGVYKEFEHDIIYELNNGGYGEAILLINEVDDGVCALEYAMEHIDDPDEEIEYSVA